MYNLSGINETETFLDMAAIINTNTQGMFGYGTLFLFWIVLFVTFKNFETRVGFLVSSALTTLLTVYFWWAGWIGYGIIFFPAGLTFIALIWNALGE